MDLLRVASGEDGTFTARALRGATALAEPFYAAAMRVRARLYSLGVFKSHKLPAPTISVGNITTGGTGKTPVVRWIAEQFLHAGKRPAILMRGYGSDEQRLLSGWLDDRAAVIANPDRVAGAAAARDADVFILDDAFQHRRVARDFDLVLIDATNPFGYGRVLPRGLLREPLDGLSRADAFIITRSDQADASAIQSIDDQIRRHAANMPTYHARHEHVGLRGADSRLLPMEELSRRRFFLFSGIGNPQSLEQQLKAYGTQFTGSRTFTDHHAYTVDNLAQLESEARRCGADYLVTTEKDWVKIAALAAIATPVLRIELRIAIDDEAALMQQLLKATSSSPGS